MNIRSARYFIVRAVGVCCRCRGRTQLFALALPPEHEILAEEDAPPGPSEGEQGAWEVARCNALLFYVTSLPAAVQTRLEELSAHYRLAYSNATLASHWSNHCEHCMSAFDDHDLFCEPEGAFSPSSPAAAAALEITVIGEPIEALADGYAPEPQFFVFTGGR